MLMKSYSWQNRVLLVFTPDLAASDFVEQNSILKQVRPGLLDRDIVVVRVSADDAVSIDEQTSPLSATSFYRHYDAQTPDFTVILIGKDGGIKLRQQRPISSEALFGLIDAMPMRQQEMLQGDN